MHNIPSMQRTAKWLWGEDLYPEFDLFRPRRSFLAHSAGYAFSAPFSKEQQGVASDEYVGAGPTNRSSGPFLRLYDHNNARISQNIGSIWTW